MKNVISLLFLCLFLSFSVQAAPVPVSEIFNQLKDSGEDFVNEGAVCEHATRLDFQKEYPAPQFEVIVGIEYANLHQTLGELDVVVFRKSDRRVVMVAEVKCWIGLKSAIKKASMQRERFRNTIAAREPVEFHLAKNRNVKFDPEQFSGMPQFVTVSQDGGVAIGFDRELDYSLAEMKDLRQKLIDCQNAGRCRKAAR